MHRRTLASPASTSSWPRHLAEDPANPNRIIAATYARGVWAYTFK